MCQSWASARRGFLEAVSRRAQVAAGAGLQRVSCRKRRGCNPARLSCCVIGIISQANLQHNGGMVAVHEDFALVSCKDHEGGWGQH